MHIKVCILKIDTQYRIHKWSKNTGTYNNYNQLHKEHKKTDESETQAHIY